jgi:signal transduction histidine kinase
MDPRRPRLIARLAQGQSGRPIAGGLSIETEVDPASLLELWSLPEHGRHCQIRDANGGLVGRERGSRPSVPPPSGEMTASWLVRLDGWSLPGPLVLWCAQPDRATLAASEPVWARYRTTYALNLAVMALSLLLGGFALQQTRRRAGLEARAAEEARVRELERQLFHAERLTTVGRLAAGIAHEINNPLEGMSNYLTLARDSLARGDVEAATRQVAAIKTGLDRAAGIVRQVLAHSDPAKAPRTPLDLNDVLRETEQFVQSRKEFGHIAFGLDLAGQPLVVHGSPVMLGQVVMNLIVNACEVQPGKGEVRVFSRREGGHVVVEVADRGPGIPESDRQRVFEPFFSTKDSTGLGLSICHTIVRQHEGELDVRPRPGGGSVFRMRLPAAPEAARPVPGATQRAVEA